MATHPFTAFRVFEELRVAAPFDGGVELRFVFGEVLFEQTERGTSSSAHSEKNGADDRQGTTRIMLA